MPAHEADLRGLAEYMAKALVESPDNVEVEAEDNGRDVDLALRVADRDLGRVIGRGGRTARCLRTILSAAAEKHGQRCSLDIVEDEDD